MQKATTRRPNVKTHHNHIHNQAPQTKSSYSRPSHDHPSHNRPSHNRRLPHRHFHSTIAVSAPRNTTTANNNNNNNNNDQGSGLSIKLSKPQIDHIKTLHQPSGRRQSGSFLIEGRKLIEAVAVGKKGFTKPRAVYMTHDQHTRMTQLLATSHPPRHTTPSTGRNDDGKMTEPQRVESFSDLVQNYRQSTFLSTSTQHRWVSRPDGTFIPPPSHSLDKTNSLSDVQHMLYSHLCGRGGAVIENALLSRLSQFSAPPGIIAEFDSLPNIIQFEYAGEGDDLVGTLRKPLFGSSIVSFGSRTQSQPHSSQQTQWDWKRGGIILAGVSDPGNLGTIMRTAHAFGLSQMVVVDGCDIYNSKVISASSGAVAHINIVTCTGTQFVEFFQDVVGEDERGVLGGGVSQLTPSLLDQSTLSTPYLVGLTPNRGIDLDQIEPSLQHHFGKLLSALQYKQKTSSTSPIHPKTTQSHSTLHQNKPWLVVGSEAFGLPSQIEDLLHIAATIPVQNDFVDSLNASVAASIAIYVTANRIGNGERSGGADVKM